MKQWTLFYQIEDEDQKEYSKRATWMNTRQLENEFVDLVGMAIQKVSLKILI